LTTLRRADALRDGQLCELPTLRLPYEIERKTKEKDKAERALTAGEP
jgi:hypothetical protein